MAAAHPSVGNDAAVSGDQHPRWHRPVRRTRTVPVTIDGRTHHATQTYTEHVAKVPHDWERTLLGIAVTVTVVVVAISLGWTTASVGGLLDLAVASGIAYAAASVFDASWIVCMIGEYLTRYDPDRARVARAAGWIALAVSMAAVFVHGYLVADIEVGLIGASVQLLAKGLWMVVLRLVSYPLDDLRRQWLVAERADVGLQHAMLRHTRSLDRVRAAIAAERAARGLPGHTVPAPGHEPGEDARAAGTIRAAVRAAAETMPDATVDELVDQLTASRITVTADDVRAVVGHARAHADTPSNVVPIDVDPEEAATIADVVRRCLDDHLDDVDAIVSVAKQVIPDVKPDSVRREVRRALRKRQAG